MTQIEERSPPIRLIICVDGTWMNQDGLEGSYKDNPTNIFRVWASIKEGLVQDSDGRIFHQRKKYVDGIGYGDWLIPKMLNGILGTGCPAQIKEVYQYCCANLGRGDDELYLFGFSRGAFVVRAVANLIHHMRLLNAAPYSAEFDMAYQGSLEMYQSVRVGGVHQKARAYHHFLTEVSNAKSVPIIKFIGVFDTVKAVGDNELYDISHVESIRNFRHAMALNETRAAFSVERCFPPKSQIYFDTSSHSLIEAWFIGGHSDLGGANSRDGLSLYPLQWILSEAAGCGLHLGFKKLDYPMDLIDNPLETVFPKDEKNGECGSPYMFESKNGIQVKLYDIRSMHRNGIFASRYAVKLNQPTGGGVLFRKQLRQPFCNGQLEGYYEDAPVGTVIHPSVYFMFDAYPSIYLNAKSWGFRNNIQDFRDTVITTEEQLFWDNAPMDTGSNLKAIRILICGNAGVGKTTLLNRIFGIQMSEASERAHGRHDVEKVFTAESNPGLLIHDSCGFQAGNTDEVIKIQSFLRSRSTTPDITERLHAIWYCTLTTRPRGTETADILFFDTMSRCASEVPIIVIGTKMDEYADMLEGKYFKSVRSSAATSRAQLAEQLEQMDITVKKQVRERQEMIQTEFESIENAKFSGPVFVSKDDPDSIQRLERTTLECLDNDHVRRLYVSAQICDVDQKIDMAITETIRLYRHSTRAAAVPIIYSGVASTSVVSLILCKNIVNCFGYSGLDVNFLDRTLRNMIWSSFDAHSLQIISSTVMLASEGAISTGIGAVAGVVGLLAGFVGHLASMPASARCVLMCACDIILILERAFWYDSTIGTHHIQAAAEEYRSRFVPVHDDVKNVVPLMGFIKSFQFSKVRLGIEGVIQKHRFQGMDDVKARNNPR